MNYSLLPFYSIARHITGSNDRDEFCFLGEHYLGAFLKLDSDKTPLVINADPYSDDIAIYWGDKQIYIANEIPQSNIELTVFCLHPHRFVINYSSVISKPDVNCIFHKKFKITPPGQWSYEVIV